MNIGKCMEYAQALCDAKGSKARSTALKELRAVIESTITAHSPEKQVPLTDDQIDELAEDGTFFESRKTIVRSIEEFHGITGEKNG